MTANPSRSSRPLVALALLLAWGCPPTVAVACPFCAAESRTLTEEMNDSSVVVLARLVEPSAASQSLADSDVPYGFVDPDTGAAKFRVEQVLFGEELLDDPAEDGARQIEAIYFGDSELERMYFIRGVGTPADWAIPLPLSEIAAEYVPKLIGLPESGADRIAFFLDYLEHDDPLLSQDAYDEFARAPYQDVIDLSDRMDREQLLAWIEDYRVSPSRRRLFLTMLGVCGTDEDVDRLEAMLTSDNRVLGPAAEAGVAAALALGGGEGLALLPESIRFTERQRKLGLDAMIACYLTLSGKHRDATTGLDLVDRRFLTDPGADYSHIYAALQALRFLAEEQQELIPLDRVLASARLLLDSPDFADQVIPDLARWEDWSVLDRLGTMYELSVTGDQEKYIREPIVTYLDVAVEQEGEIGERAAATLARIEPLDPAAVKRARSLRAFGFLAQARAKTDAAIAPPTEPLAADPVAPAGEPPVGEPPVGEPLVDATVEADAVEADALEADPAEPAAAAGATAETTVVATPPVANANVNAPDPPSRMLLIGTPLLAAVVCVGIFWAILRGGAA